MDKQLVSQIAAYFDAHRGDVPYWVQTIQAARFANVPPWELSDIDRDLPRDFWRGRILIVMEAERVYFERQARRNKRNVMPLINISGGDTSEITDALRAVGVR
jgi:hypothetical protein